MIKILAVSDTVDPLLYAPADVQRFGDFSLILSCGDLPPEYLSRLTHTFGTPLFYVRGNHDIRYETTPPAGCVDIHARLVRFHGLNILGLEGSRWYNGGPYQYTEREMRGLLRRLRPLIWWKKGIDVVITHAPPRGVHDQEDLCHRGFRSFRRLIDKYKPRYFIHGHIHKNFDSPSDRISVVGETRVVNAYGWYAVEIEEPRNPH